MPIHAPGYRPSNSRVNRLGSSKRNVVAVLSLTAMVDMFTVLTIFLLQNYNPNMAEILDIPEKVILPQAEMSRPITPSHVVNITPDSVSLGTTQLVSVEEVKAQTDWMIRPLFTRIQQEIAAAKKKEEENFRKQLQKAVYGQEKSPEMSEKYRKVTVQADKETDFSIIKKVMFTITEAGGGEISFAVLKKPE